MLLLDAKPERFILVIDANRNHTDVIRQVLGQKPGRYGLAIVEDRAAAMDYLRPGSHADRSPRPDLVLLDLNLPATDGHALLAEIKATPSLVQIPVIVLTEGDRPEDILRSYASQGNCYVVKAADLDQLAQTIKRIEDFWLEIVTLPLK